MYDNFFSEEESILNFCGKDRYLNKKRFEQLGTGRNQTHKIVITRSSTRSKLA